MTTSHEEKVYVKPIIVSHHNLHHQSQETQSQIASSSFDNSIFGVPKSNSASFKRVSFGNAKGTVVETFIYESVPTIEEGYYGPSLPSTSNAQATRSGKIDSPPTKVKVKTLESQIPFPISPPSLVTSVGVTRLNNGAVISGSVNELLGFGTRTDTYQLTSSTSLQRMDEGSDNPFRPDGRLSHEVEPIVECYKKRPFPGSPGSDFIDGVIVGAGSSKSPPSSPPGKKATSPSVAKSSKNGGTKDSSVKPQDIKLTLTTADGQNTQLEIQHRQVMSPKAGHVEVVHIGEKRKRCGCCSIQ